MWVKHNNQTFQIMAYNIHKNKEAETHELWVTRVDGKAMKLLSFDEEYVQQYKDMFDYAVKHGEHLVEV